MGKRAIARRMEKEARKSKPVTTAPFANYSTKLDATDFPGSVQKLKNLEMMYYKNGWRDGEDWSDLINVVCMLNALVDLHQFGKHRMFEVMQASGNYQTKLNTKQTSLLGMIDRLEQKGLKFSEQAMNVAKRYEIGEKE